jgi:hypothetical protein
MIDHILWDFEPRQLMQPRCGEGVDAAAGSPRSGYILYIETMDKQPGLFLMIQNASGYAETFAKIDEVPDTLIAEAVEENRTREYCKMYPINAKLKDWLKSALGVTS